MKIKVNDQPLFELSDIQKKVMCNDIPEDLLEADLKRRLKWVLMHKYERCFQRLKDEWDKKLIHNGVTSVPTHPDEYAELVFQQPNYQNAQERNAPVRLDNQSDREG